MENAAGKLKRWLELNHLRQVDFAEQVGVGQPTVAKWLQGCFAPGWPQMRRIHTATGGFIRPDDWLSTSVKDVTPAGAVKPEHERA